MMKRIPNRLAARFLSEWAITHVIKTSDAFNSVRLGEYAAAIDKDIVAFGSSGSAYDVSSSI